jgi:hypothetical protein
VADKHKIARDLALQHFKVEEGMVQIFRLLAPDEAASETVKLLEVNRDTIPTGILPLRFNAVPARGIPLPSVIIEITPEELDKVRTHELALPEDWEIGEEILRDASRDAH